MKTIRRGVPVLFLFVSLQQVTAHDLYLVTGIDGARNKICARVGEHFPDSMNAVNVERIATFQVHAAGRPTPLKPEVDKKQTCAPYRESGPAVVEMVVRPVFIHLEAKDFNSYIEGEGFGQVIAARRQSKKTERPGRELYSRYSKLLLGANPKATARLGHVLEIVPQKDPATLKAGEALPVQVLFRGRPLPGVQVSAAYAGAEMKGHSYPVSARTDTRGIARLKLDRGGWWYARLIHMVAAKDDPDVDWRSFFTTVTFQVSTAAK